MSNKKVAVVIPMFFYLNKFYHRYRIPIKYRNKLVGYRVYMPTGVKDVETGYQYKYEKVLMEGYRGLFK